MNLELTGNVAIVFGAARGLGFAIAGAFAREGCRVVLADASPSVAEAARRLSTEGLAATAEQLDVSDSAAVWASVDRTRATFGQLDHAVFAVAVASGKFGFPFWNLEPSDWDRVLKVNLTGAANVAHALAPGMAEARSGTLLFISSVAGQIGSQTDPPYSASKAGLINFMQCAAKDLAPFGVRVNAICPGMVKTELARAVWQAWADRQPPDTLRTYDEWAEDKVRRQIPLGRWQTEEDIANMAVFLASARAGNVTGQTINVDGGYVMH